MEFEDFNYVMYNPFILLEERDDDDDVDEESKVLINDVRPDSLPKYIHEDIKVKKFKEVQKTLQELKVHDSEPLKEEPE